MADMSSPWQLLLAQLHKPVGKKPKCVLRWQQFASVEKRRIRKAALSGSNVNVKNMYV